MYQIIVENKLVAVVVILIILIALCILFVKVIQTLGMEKVRGVVYKAFVEAENNFKYGDNHTKFEYVVNAAKEAVPFPFNMFITEHNLRKVIQLWFSLCKDLLDDGRVNGTGKDNKEEKKG